MSIHYNIKLFENYLKENNIKYEKIIINEYNVCLKLSDLKIIDHLTPYEKQVDKYHFNNIIGFIRKINYLFDQKKWNEDLEKYKLNSLLKKIDKVLSNRQITITFEDNKEFGGYSVNRNQIYIFCPLKKELQQYLDIVPGINFHEVGHVLFTCSFTKLLKEFKVRYAHFDVHYASYNSEKKNIIAEILIKIANIFEDCRIENIMGNKYGYAIPYFKNSYYNLIFKGIKEKLEKNEDINELDCILTIGRKYLDLEVRKQFIQLYAEKNSNEKAIRVNSYINKYITLSWTNNKQEMIDLIIGFYFEFIKKTIDETKSANLKTLMSILFKYGMTKANIFEDDEKLENIDQQLLQKLLKSIINEGKGKTLNGDDFLKLVENNLKNSSKELENITNNIKNTLDKGLYDIEKNNNYKEKSVNDFMANESSRLTKTLQEFKRKCRAGYKNLLKKGNVNVNEARRQEYKRGTKIFKRYNSHIRKALDIDVAFVLDCSSSMSLAFTVDKITEISKQLWIAYNACKTVGTKLRIFTFNSDFKGIMTEPKNNKLYKIPIPEGQTKIFSTLCEVENYFNNSKSKTKWLIILTDGEICDKHEHAMMIEKFKNKGISCGKINLYTKESMMDCMDEVVYDQTLNLYLTNVNRIYTCSDSLIYFFKKIYETSLEREQC